MLMFPALFVFDGWLGKGRLLLDEGGQVADLESHVALAVNIQDHHTESRDLYLHVV